MSKIVMFTEVSASSLDSAQELRVKSRWYVWSRSEKIADIFRRRRSYPCLGKGSSRCPHG